MTQEQIGLRERTRRAVRQEITSAANALFLQRGYEATTIEDIATVVGLSPRSLFRYFPTKEDIVLGKFEFVAEEMIEVLRARPLDEPVWTSLRRIFDVITRHADEVDPVAVVEPVQRIVFETPALFGSYLHKLQVAQNAVANTLRQRATAAQMPYPANDQAPEVLAGAAFACFLAAQQSWPTGGSEGALADWIDRAMSCVEPTTASR